MAACNKVDLAGEKNTRWWNRQSAALTVSKGYELKAVCWGALRGTGECRGGIDKVGGVGIGMVQSLPERGWRSRILLDGSRMVI